MITVLQGWGPVSENSGSYILSRFSVAYRSRIFWTVFLLHSQKLTSPLSLSVFTLMRFCCLASFEVSAVCASTSNLSCPMRGVHLLIWTLRQTPALHSLPFSPCLLQKKCERYWAQEQEPLQIGLFCITLVSWGRGGNSTLWSLGCCGRFHRWFWVESFWAGPEQFSHSPSHTAGSALVLALQIVRTNYTLFLHFNHYHGYLCKCSCAWLGS